MNSQREMLEKQLFADALSRKLTRRQVLQRAAALGLSAPAIAMLLSACGDEEVDDEDVAAETEDVDDVSAPEDDDAIEDDDASDPDAAPDIQLDVGDIPDVDRSETLIMSVSDNLNQFTDVELQNPFMQGVHRTGWHFAFESLYYYNAFHSEEVSGPDWNPGTEGEIPYLAESYEYNDDHTQLTIKLREGVTWSDGETFNSDDVVFTINMLKDNAPELTWSFDMDYWVDEIEALDEYTVLFTLTQPNPQFMFTFFQWHMDIGFPIVPQHIFEGEDPLTFTNYDLDRNWPITTGPWRLVYSSAEQKIWDRRDDWWGAETGFHRLPAMKRIIVAPRVEDAQKAQLLASGEVDTTHNIQPADTEVALAQNPDLQVFTADGGPPYGSLDWWTNSLGFNCMEPPFDDPEIRWAINHAISREQIVQVGFDGAGQYTILPFPAYPSMLPYFDAIEGIVEDYPIDDYDPDKTASIMESKGYTRDSEGFWTMDGERLEIVITTLPGFFQHFVPVIVENLRQAGFDAAFRSPENAGTLQLQGEVDAFLNGHGGGIRDPYRTLFMFHSSQAAETGEPAQRPYRWVNAEFDALVEEIGRTAIDDPRYMELYLEAMEIWIPELPVIPTVQWYLITPVNTRYWTGWPNETNPYTAPAMWHRGSATLVINSLEPA